MVYNYFNWVHVNTIFHAWDIPAFILAGILVVMILCHNHNQKKRESDFEEKLEKKNETAAEAAGETGSQAVR